MPTVQLHHSDCLSFLATLDDNSIDAICTDPPAGISFMGKKWDDDKGGRKQWIAWLTTVMTEALRVCKPGGHAFVWALPKTSHWTATALEDAGWEVREKVYHLFGSGFPKSQDVSKMIDKSAGAEREVVGINPHTVGRKVRSFKGVASAGQSLTIGGDIPETAAASPEAQQWAGWGTALKPAAEEWILVRKPLSEKTIAANVLKWGTGALNIDAARIAGKLDGDPNRFQKTDGGWAVGSLEIDGFHEPPVVRTEGRWPANTVFSHSPECRLIGTKKVDTSTGVRGASTHIYGGGKGFTAATGETVGYADADGTETVEAWECVEGCAVAEVDRQSGMSKSTTDLRKAQATGGSWFTGKEHPRTSRGDIGGASRFFYVAKPSRREKDLGVEGENRHPTVKAVALMNHLLAMIVPPDGVVLDLFMGTGTTGVAAVQRGVSFIGVDADEESVETARQRIAHAEEERPIETPSHVVVKPTKAKKRRAVDPNQISLFGDTNAQE